MGKEYHRPLDGAALLSMARRRGSHGRRRGALCFGSPRLTAARRGSGGSGASVAQTSRRIATTPVSLDWAKAALAETWLDTVDGSMIRKPSLVAKKSLAVAVKR